MIFRTTASPLLMLVAACSAGGGDIVPATATLGVEQTASSSQALSLADPRNAVALADSASIAGRWDVVSLEGYEPRRLSGTIRAAFADFGAEGVALRIECNYSGRSGSVREGRFVVAENNDRLQTAMSCGAERNERESRFFTFFENGPTIERLGSDRLRLRSGSAELILQRPEARRLAFLPTAAELQGVWRLVEVTRYLEGNGHSGIGLTEVPGRIAIAGDRLVYDRCPQYGLSFSLTADGTLRKVDGTAPPAAPVGCPDLAEPAPSSELPGQWDVLRLLHSHPKLERSGTNSLLVSTERLGLLLTRAPAG